MPERARTILVVEGDPAFCSLVSTALSTHGYRLSIATSGSEALAAMASGRPDIMLLGLELPDIDGIELIRRVRTWSIVPIIVVSASAEGTDKIAALDAGADDYLSRPISVSELLTLIRVTERHLAYLAEGAPLPRSTFVNDGLAIDYAAATVSLDGTEIHLTPMEYRLLCLLAHNVDRVLTHKRILREVWGSDQDGDLASLRVLMGTLRKKIEADSSRPRYIQTHVGVGYRMVSVSVPAAT